MYTEYEATFLNIDKDEIRGRLRGVGATLVRPEYMQKRIAFDLPSEHGSIHEWVRVRDEGDKITLSYKKIDGDEIHNQKEIQITVDDFDKAVELLSAIGCGAKAFQESKRELWKIDDTEITIDEWPFLEPFVEIEGESEEVVRKVAEKLGFNWSEAKFCAVGALYEMKYGIDAHRINKETPRITFDMENPFTSPNS